MLQSGRSPVIPLWIKGHAFLTATSSFLDVRNPANGEVLRRTPLCGVREALIALAELTARCGFPPGVFSILHGAVAAIDGLCRLSGVKVLYA